MPATPIIWRDINTINTTDNVSGNNNQRQVRVVQLDNGNLLYIWTSDANPVGGAGNEPFQDIIGQIYDPLGNAIGGEFTVSTHFQIGSDGRTNASITALDDGGFMVVWRDIDINFGTPSDIEFRSTIFSEDGSVVSEQTLSTLSTVGAVENIEIASLLHSIPSNDHVDVFMVYESGADGEDLSFQILNGGTGVVQVAETSIVSQTGGNINGHAVAALHNETFAVAYARQTSSGSESVLLRMYETDGSYIELNIGGVPQGPNVTRSVSNAFSDYSDPSIAVLSGGNVVVSYTVDSSGGTNTGIRFRVLGDDYSFITAETNPVTSNAGNQTLSEVAALDNNEFLVVWYDEATHEIMGQRHNGTGVQIGAEFTIENYGTQVVQDISLESMDDGRVVVSWTVNTSGNNQIQSEIYDPRDDAHDYVTDGGYQIGTTLSDDFIVDAGISPHGDTTVGVYAYGGHDVIHINGDILDAGVIIDGGGGTDTIVVESGAGLTFDFRGVSLLNVETITFGAPEGIVQLSEAQYASILDFTFSGATVETVEIYLDASTNYTLTLPSTTLIGTEDRFHVIGDASAETITGSSRGDIISGLGGNDILNGANGDDVLNGGSGDDTLNGGFGNDRLVGGGGVDTFDGGAGSDTVDYSASMSGATIDLAAGTASFFGGGVVETFTSVENIIGSQADDIIYEATGVANDIYGEGGVNTIYISSDIGEDNVFKTNGGTNIIDFSGNTQVGIEFYDNYAEHNGLTSILEGRIIGTNQHDVFFVRNFSGAQLDGNGGNDYFDAGGGSATLNGGAGIDTIDYIATRVEGGLTAIERVVVDLNAGTVDKYFGGVVVATDLLVSFEIFYGTYFGDTIIGNADDNTFYGSRGDDVINGGAGNETIYGDNESTGAIGTVHHGDDIINGGAGDDIIFGGGGDDTIDAGPGIDVVDAGEGDDLVIMSVGAGNGTGASYNGGAGVSDTLDMSALSLDGTYSIEDDFFDAGLTGANGDFEMISFEIIIMGAGDDTIYGGNGGSVVSLEVFSGGGDDVVSGGRGNNTLDGGTGIDTLDYSFVSTKPFTTITAVTVDLAAGTATNEYGGSDTISNFENVIGTALDDTITGDAGANILNGMDGNDILSGGSGNDLFIGGAGADTIIGGSGNDTLSYVGSDAAVSLNLVTHVITGGHATGDTISGILNIVGSSFGDVLVGDSNKNTLDGDKGNDTLDGGIGIDHLIGGQGDDLLLGGADADINDGGSGFDTVDYSGASGNVKVYLGTGGTTGDAAGDTYISIERVIGTNFGDLITGAAADETLDGGLGNDELFGEGGADIINGGDGDDFISGGAGLDTLDGGAGVDTVDYSGTNAAYDVNMATGVTTFAGETAINFENLIIGNGDNVITGTDAANNIQTNGGDDTIYAGLGDDTVDGGDGDDTIDGGAGDDVINGGLGVNVIEGGAGADTLDGGASGLSTVMYGGAVGVTVSLLSGLGSGGDAQGDVLSNFLNLSGTGSHDTLTGDAQNNGLLGNAGNDVLDGGAGDDSLDGGSGADRILGGAGADANIGGAGFDVMDYRGASSRVAFDMTTSGTVGDAAGDTYSGLERIYGSNFNDAITGTDANEFFHGEDGNDTINAGGGIDRLYGGAGNDVLRGQGGNDLLYGSAGNDQMNGGIGFDIASYDNATSFVSVNLATGGTVGDAAGDTYFGIESVYGSDFDDIITGNTSANELRGGAGDDTLDGGGGNDRLFGGMGADSLVGGAGADIAMYTVATAGVALNLATGGTGGEATGDSFSSIEWVFGSDFDDVITGDSASNRLEGRAGNDTLNGGAGNDRLLGGDGDDIINGGDGVDVIFGQNGSDTLTGGAGNDFFFGSAGGDSMDGGADFDTVNYLASAAGVTLNLQTGGTGGEAMGDSYISIERVFGTQFDDSITGSNGNDVLKGNGGDDYLNGGMGNDSLFGGAGVDSFGYDTTNGGADAVNGFVTGSETIYILGGDTNFDSFAELSAVATNAGANVIFNFGGGNTMTIVGRNIADLSAGDFDFSGVAPAGEAPDAKRMIAEDLVADGVQGQDLIADFLKAVPVLEHEAFEYVDSNGMLAISADIDGLWDVG